RFSIPLKFDHFSLGIALLALAISLASIPISAMAARQFEKPEAVNKAPKGRDEIHEQRWQTRGERRTTEYDSESDLPMSEVYRNKNLLEEYKKVGFHEHGKAFLSMMEKWEKDEELTGPDREMREDVREVCVTRLGIVKACEKLLTPDVFKGVG